MFIETMYSDPDFLEHHGIKGMKWGVRRYQNYDGTRIGTNSRSGGGGGSNKKSLKDYRYVRFYRDSNDKARLGFTSKKDEAVPLKDIPMKKKHIADSIASDPSTTNEKVRKSVDRKDIETLKDLQKKMDTAYKKVDWDKEFEAEEAYDIAYYKRAYDATYKDLERYMPDSLEEMIKANGGSKEGLDRYHDFDTAMDGYDEPYNPPKSKEAAEWDKAFTDYYNKRTEIVDKLVGQNKSKLVDESYQKYNGSFGDTVDKFIQEELDNIVYEELGKPRK